MKKQNVECNKPKCSKWMNEGNVIKWIPVIFRI